MNRRVQIKKAPIAGGMVILPDELLAFYGWKVGMYLRLTVDQDGHVVLQRYHARKEEKV